MPLKPKPSDPNRRRCLYCGRPLFWKAGSTFSKHSYFRVYCSNPCRQAMYRVRKRVGLTVPQPLACVRKEPTDA